MIYLAIVNGLLIFVLVLMTIRCFYWRNLCLDVQAHHADLCDEYNTLVAEMDEVQKGAAAVEHTMQLLLSRPIFAQLNDSQAGALIQTVQSWLAAIKDSQTSPDRLA